MAQTVAEKVQDVEVQLAKGEERLARVEERLTIHDEEDQRRHQESIDALTKVEAILNKQFDNLWLLVKILIGIASIAGLGRGTAELVPGLLK